MKRFDTIENIKIGSGSGPTDFGAIAGGLTAVTALALYGLLTWHLLFFWEVNPQYNYGWLVPGLAIFVFLRRWSSRPRIGSAPRWIGPALTLCLTVLALIWLVREATPDWSVVTWLLALTIVVALLLILGQCGGISWLIHFAFPVCFMLCAVPWPQRIEFPMVQGLMRFVSGAASEMLNWAGIPAVATGSLIRLPSGSVAIDDACSGIRSLQAMVMIALFLGEFRNLSVVRRTMLVAFAIAGALILNLARTTALVLAVSRWGVTMFDAWHIPTGHALQIAGLVLLSGLAFLLAPSPKQPILTESITSGGNVRALPAIASVLILLWIATILGATEIWYESNEKHLHHNTLEVNWPEPLSSYREIAVPENIQQGLLYSTGRMASWRDKCVWSLFTFRWAPARTATLSARMHRPDTCFQASGAVLERELEPVTVTIGTANVMFESYLFDLSGQPLFVFFTIWEESNRDAKSPALRQDWSGWSRVQRAFTRERNLGQQSLEFVLAGLESYGEAVQIFRDRLPGLVRCRDLE
jgi:exosortase